MSGRRKGRPPPGTGRRLDGTPAAAHAREAGDAPQHEAAAEVGGTSPTGPANGPAGARRATPAPARAPAPAWLDDRTSILVVDDLPENRLVYRTVLEDLGQEIVAVGSGPEALRQVLRHDFAVILLDVNMPGMDGFETATLIRGRRRSAHVPIIFVTALPDEMRMAEAYAHGAVDYILSPIVPEILRAKVQVFVDLFVMSARAQRQAEEHLALADERARRAAAEESNRRLEFLVEAGAVLGHSLDREATARDLVRVTVPFLGDVAALAMPEPGRPPRVVLARLDGEAPLVEEHDGLEGLPGEVSAALARVLASPGDTPLLDDSGGATPPRVLALPLTDRDQVLGALVLSREGSGRTFGPAERSMAQVVARRGALALLNARLYADVQQADSRKDQFLAMLAHELRNPLWPIRNAVEILRLLGIEHEGLHATTEIIERQVTHMGRLVDDLLDATRIARGKVLLRREGCDLARVVRQAAEDHRHVLEGSGIALAIDVGTAPLWVEGDVTRLAQIVGNLLHNAHKFTNAGGRVTVSVRCPAPGGMAEVVVADTGIGIEPTLLPRIFDVFSQGDGSLARSRGGLGLGLALVKGLVALHGGDVHAASDGPGRGARFTLRLPLAIFSPLPRERAAHDDDGRRYRVLVVEDNPDAAASTRLLLEMAGHQVHTEACGTEGLVAARAFQPHVVLCDIGLPGAMNGYEVARALRREPALQRVGLIALSGYGRDEDRQQSQEAGFDLHLTKPVEADGLIAALTALAARATGGARTLDGGRPDSEVSGSLA